MTDIKCLDSSAWLEYYLNAHPTITALVDKGGLLYTSSLSFFEIKKKLLKSKKDFKELLQFIKERSIIIVPGAIICEKAADVAIELQLAAIDALIYTTATMSNAELITADNDFRKLENVKIIS